LAPHESGGAGCRQELTGIGDRPPAAATVAAVRAGPGAVGAELDVRIGRRLLDRDPFALQRIRRRGLELCAERLGYSELGAHFIRDLRRLRVELGSRLDRLWRPVDGQRGDDLAAVGAQLVPAT